MDGQRGSMGMNDPYTELVADFCGDVLLGDSDISERAIREMCGEERTLAQKIRDAIANMMELVRGTKKEDELRHVLDMFEEGLSDAENGDVRYSTNNKDPQGHEYNKWYKRPGDTSDLPDIIDGHGVHTTKAEKKAINDALEQRYIVAKMPIKEYDYISTNTGYYLIEDGNIVIAVDYDTDSIEGAEYWYDEETYGKTETPDSWSKTVWDGQGAGGWYGADAYEGQKGRRNDGLDDNRKGQYPGQFGYDKEGDGDYWGTEEELIPGSYVWDGENAYKVDEKGNAVLINLEGADDFSNSTNRAQEERIESSDATTRYSIRTEEPPKKTGKAYKVFLLKDGKLYPPMVANPDGAGTDVGVWLNADAAPRAADSKTGRMQVQAGGKGTNVGKTTLAYRPGWHLGDIPNAKQFAKKNPETGVKELFPANFVWAECEYAADYDYQEEAMSYGYNKNGKFQHSLAGLPKVPTDGYYRYRTNPNPDTVPWVITGAMKVNRILTDAETDAICRAAGVEPMQRMGGPITKERLKEMGIERLDYTENERLSLPFFCSSGNNRSQYIFSELDGLKQ